MTVVFGRSRNRKILGSILFVGFSLALGISLFPQHSIATFSMFASIVMEDMIGDLIPLEERSISRVVIGETSRVVTTTCKRQFFDYSVYLDIHDFNADGDIVRHFVAEKDTRQDCNEFVVDSVEVQNGGSAIKIEFRNNSHKIVSVRN